MTFSMQTKVSQVFPKMEVADPRHYLSDVKTHAPMIQMQKYQALLLWKKTCHDNKLLGYLSWV